MRRGQRGFRAGQGGVAQNRYWFCLPLLLGGHRHDLNQLLQPSEIFRVEGIEPSSLDQGRCCDDQVEYPRAWAPPDLRHGLSAFGISACYTVIDWDGVERALDLAEPAKPSRQRRRSSGLENSEVQFREADHRDRVLLVRVWAPRRDQGARVEYDAQTRPVQGSTTESSRSSERSACSSDQTSSVCVLSRSSISRPLRQRLEPTGTSRAAGRPATVTRISSPSSTRRTRSEACCRSSRSPTVSFTAITVAHVLLKPCGRDLKYR